MIDVDCSPTAVRFAEAFCPQASFAIQDLRALHLNASFDAIVLLDVLEHIMPKDIAHLMTRLASHMKKGGLLIISVPSTNLSLEPRHYQHFTPQTLRLAVQEYIDVSRIEGLHECGLHGFVYQCAGHFATLLLPLRSLPGVRTRYRFLAEYYERRVAQCEPEKAMSLLAVCIKK